MLALLLLTLMAKTSQPPQLQPLPIKDGQVVPLWTGAAPGALGTEEGDIPTITVYLPRNMTATTPAMIVCPGGGHNILAYDLEGTEVAEWLNQIGVTAVLLKYRVPYRNPEKRWFAAVQDGQRA